MSFSTSSRRSQHALKPTIIQSREPSTDSRSSDSSASSYYSSSRSSTSNNYHTSSQSRVYHEPGHVYTFRAPDSDNYKGTYTYSRSNKIKVINHNISVEEDPRLHSSGATYKDYNRSQQRVERNRSDRK